MNKRGERAESMPLVSITPRKVSGMAKVSEITTKALEVEGCLKALRR